MFGLIYTAVSSAAYVVAKSIERIENNENRKKYISKDGLTYIDNKTRSRLLSNNHIAMYHSFHPSCYGDYVLEDIEDHIIIKNFSKEKREKEYAKKVKNEKMNGNTTVCITNITEDRYGLHNGFMGELYKDLNTGALYVIRKFNYRHYYMNIKNGHIIRETDYSRKHIEDYSHIREPINIEEFNKKQDENLKTYNYADIREPHL